MSPFLIMFIFFGSVFSIMNKKIGFSRKLDIRFYGKATPVNKAEFIICEENKSFSIFSEFVSASVVRVAQRYRGNRYRTYFKGGWTSIRIDYICFQIRVSYGKIGRR